MLEISTLTNHPNQLHTLILTDNETANFRLFYCGRMQEWYYDLEYKNLIINGRKVVLTPNSLRQFRNIIPFGIAFYADSSIEPFEIDAFKSGRVKMAILDSEEVAQIEEQIYND